MSTQNEGQVPLRTEVEPDVAEMELLDEDDPFAELWDDDDDGFARLFSDGRPEFEIPDLLVPDIADEDRILARQKEMMDTVFGGIGEERKPEKRAGLALQQLDIEQRHALRLLLIYPDTAELTAHLNRCLADPAYGYGERGDQGRTIAQGMAALNALTGGSPDEVGEIAAAWLLSHHAFQQNVLSGVPFSFLSSFESGDLDNFVPLVQRVGDTTWLLGIEGEGQHRDFQGQMVEVWPRLADTYVAWVEADNELWLADLKKRAADHTPDSIFRTARADRLRLEQETVTLHRDGQITVSKAGKEGDWPCTITMRNDVGEPLLGLSRLSGHSFYALSWNDGFNSRYFELSSTTRQKVPFEHIELALWLAETLGAELGLQPEPVTPAEVERAYLRRMKATTAQIGPPSITPPDTIEGKAVASYRVESTTATLLTGSERDVVYVVDERDPEQALLLRRDPRKGLLLALPVRRGRPRSNTPLMSTPLAELDKANPVTNRALAAWGCWLLGATLSPASDRGRGTEENQADQRAERRRQREAREQERAARRQDRKR